VKSQRNTYIPVAVFVLGAALGYCFRDQILAWLQAPLQSTVNRGDVPSVAYPLLASLLVGLLLVLPVVAYHLISFFRPALPLTSRAQIFRLLALSYALSLGGPVFAYYVSLPLVLLFTTHVDILHLHTLISAGSYLSFVIAYLAVFAVAFQLPLLLLYIDRFMPIPLASLKRWRKRVVIGTFGAAIILPIVPDPVSQIMLALPVVALYETTLWLVVLAHRRRVAPAARMVAHVERPAPRPLQPGTRPVRDATVSSRLPTIDMRPTAKHQTPPGQAIS
jgi:sec-independent protein translocase protein TatC